MLVKISMNGKRISTIKLQHILIRVYSHDYYNQVRISVLFLPPIIVLTAAQSIFQFIVMDAAKERKIVEKSEIL